MLYVTRSIEVIRMIELFREIGTPADREWSRANLPVDIEMQPDAFIPTIPGCEWSLNCLALDGIYDFGWYAHQVFDPRRFNHPILIGLNSVPTLLDQLKLLLRSMREESNYHSNGIWYGEDEIWVVFPNPDSISEIETRVCEWGRVLDIVHLVQNSVGTHWRPRQIGFIAAGLPCEQALSHFPDTRFLGAQDATSITIPKNLLATSAKAMPLAETLLHNQAPARKAIREDSFFAPLKEVLKPYLPSGRPSIREAAKISETSSRSLQRRLAERGLTYRKLLGQCAFEVAADLLRTPELRIIDVANAAGYDDPANFTRAFRRIAGVTPTEYRMSM